MKQKVEYFENRAKSLLIHDSVLKVNCKGMVAGIIFDSTELSNKVVEYCLLNGVLPVCTFRESIKLGPPLTITIDAIAEVFDVIEQSLGE